MMMFHSSINDCAVADICAKFGVTPEMIHVLPMEDKPWYPRTVPPFAVEYHCIHLQPMPKFYFDDSGMVDTGIYALSRTVDTDRFIIRCEPMVYAFGSLRFMYFVGKCKGCGKVYALHDDRY